MWNQPLEYLISRDQTSIWRLLEENTTTDIFLTSMTSTIQPYCRTVWGFKSTPQDNNGSWEGVDFVSDGHSASPSVVHYAAFCTTARLQFRLQICQLGCHGSQWSDRNVPIIKDISVLFSHGQNIFSKFVLSNTKGIPSWMQQYRCCSPKINNVPSYTTRLSSALWIWMESMSNAASRLRRQLHSPYHAYHQFMVISRVSGSSTGIEWAQGGSSVCH